MVLCIILVIIIFSGGSLKAGSSRTLFGLSESFPVVSIVGLGKKNESLDPCEEMDGRKETIRSAIAG